MPYSPGSEIIDSQALNQHDDDLYGEHDEEQQIVHGTVTPTTMEVKNEKSIEEGRRDTRQ